MLKCFVIQKQLLSLHHQTITDMKTLILTIATILITVTAMAKTKGYVIVEKTFGRYTWMPSTYQVKTTDSLKKAGFKPTGVRYISGGKMIVRFIKAA